MNITLTPEDKRFIAHALMTKALVYGRCAKATPNDNLKNIYLQDKEKAMALSEQFLSE